MNNENVSHSDVLVIGGGLAGCWAAIRAADFAQRVTLVDKAKVSKSGASPFTNQLLSPVPPDELTTWREEFVHTGEFFNDQEWVSDVL